jgi:hypothetical protein
MYRVINVTLLYQFIFFDSNILGRTSAPLSCSVDRRTNEASKLASPITTDNHNVFNRTTDVAPDLVLAMAEQVTLSNIDLPELSTNVKCS